MTDLLAEAQRIADRYLSDYFDDIRVEDKSSAVSPLCEIHFRSWLDTEHCVRCQLCDDRLVILVCENPYSTLDLDGVGLYTYLFVEYGIIQLVDAQRDLIRSRQQLAQARQYADQFVTELQENISPLVIPASDTVREYIKWRQI